MVNAARILEKIAENNAESRASLEKARPSKSRSGGPEAATRIA